MTPRGVDAEPTDRRGASPVQPPPPASPSAQRSWRQGVVRGVALVLVALSWLAIAGVGGPLVGRLSEVQENDNASFLPQDAEATRANAVASQFSDSESIPYFLLVERPGGLRPGDLTAVQSLAGDLQNLRVRAEDGAGSDAADLPLVGELLTNQPVVPVPSQDGEALLVAIPLDAQEAALNLPDGRSVVYAVATTLRAAAGEELEPSGLRTYVTGPGGILADFVTAFEGIDGRLLQVTLLVVFVILLLVYRSPILPFVALLSALFALAAAGLVVYPLADAGVIDLSGQSQGILFILVVGAATDYALLLVARYREELHDHSSRFEAMRRAWRATLEPVLASGATVVLGLLCLLLADLGSTRGLGPVGAIGVLAAMLSALTFLPVLLLMGRWVFWPRVPRVDHVHSDAVDGRGVWPAVARLVGRRPRAVWAVTLAALLALAAFAPTFEAQGTSQTDVFRDRVESVTGQEVLAEHFPAGSGSPAVVVVPQGLVEEALAVAQETTGVQGARVVTGAPPGVPAPAKVVEGTMLVEAVLEADPGSRAAETAVASLRERLDQVSAEVLVGGSTASNLDVRQASERDLVVIVPTILLVVLLVLVVLLRSLVAPVLLVVANVISFAATIGAAALVFEHVLDLPGSDPAIPLYGFVFLVALGIDYSIFLMTRVREESVRRGTRPGILVGLAVTGGVITSAGIVLASTFSALVTLPLVFLLQIAFIVAFGVLLDTLVVRSLLVPAVAYDLGPRVWAPGRLSRVPAMKEAARP